MELNIDEGTHDLSIFSSIREKKMTEEENNAAEDGGELILFLLV
jgi:hypothetical protein